MPIIEPKLDKKNINIGIFESNFALEKSSFVPIMICDKAKKYCLCTINKLSERYSDQEIDLIFQKKPEEIMKATEFAAIYCENK